jgi:hypothetical protein
MLTNNEELLDVKVGDRLVSLTARVGRVYASRDGKHTFLDMESAEGDIVKVKAFGENGDRLKGLAQHGKILAFEALRADEIKFKGKTPFDYELNFLKCSEVKEIADKEEAECEYDFSKMEAGKKYIVECFVVGKLKDIGEGTVGGKIVDKIGNKAEMHIKGSLEEVMKKIDVALKMKKYNVEAPAYKVTVNAIAKGSKGINLALKDASAITNCVPWTDPLPKKRQLSPTNSSADDDTVPPQKMSKND